MSSTALILVKFSATSRAMSACWRWEAYNFFANRHVQVGIPHVQPALLPNLGDDLVFGLVGRHLRLVVNQCAGAKDVDRLAVEVDEQ